MNSHYTWYTDLSQFITCGIIRTVLSLLSGQCSCSCCTLTSNIIVRLSGNVTDRLKAAGLPRTQFRTKRSAVTVAVIGGDIATHFHLDTQMSLPTGLCKDIT